MKLLSIASGSSGNCIYVGNNNTSILIDAGISKKRIEEGLSTIGLSLRDMDAILVTHEHADHISGLGVLSRACYAPIYTTIGTKAGIFSASNLGKIDEEQFVTIAAGEDFLINDISVHAMRISHDANDPVAYTFHDGDKHIAVATDMGYMTDENEQQLRGMNAILLEANHDLNMLQVGPYPYYLKQRIMGDKGHLSNESAGRALSRLVHDDLKHIVLGHLSHENNYPQLAYEAVRLEITMGDNPYNASDFDIRVAARKEPGRCIEI
ncbi:MAG: MBL fold metallo-hydrolase [Lachnospiraceae bacterium]|nr:MBL fold metallo-hydrolase [Lachnospiraceae bacterium]